MEKVRPEPAEVLHVCKNQVAELELWLHQANVAFEPETLDADMQQVVEQQLVGCQVRLLGLSSWPVYVFPQDACVSRQTQHYQVDSNFWLTV